MYSHARYCVEKNTKQIAIKFGAVLLSPKNDLPLFAHVLFSTKNEKTVSSFCPKIIVFFSPMVSRFTFWKPLSQN
jgi:hypothetical protein